MKGRKNWLIGLLICFALQGVMHKVAVYPTWKKYDMPKSQGLAVGLDPGQLLAAMAGFRELVAGILWVKADSFFDSGNYDAVLPLIRLVTWLDPHQLDVYATGMWHIGYNFTDEESRSDRRYLPAAIALGKEGAKQNPNTYEMFFETGWLWYHKIDDQYDRAVGYFEEAGKRKDMLAARHNLLANAYQRDGQVVKSLDLYYKLFDDAQARFTKDSIFQARQIRDTIENNLDTLIVRMIQRGYFAQSRKDGSFESGMYDVNPPYDVGFSVKVTVEEPKIIRFEGTWNVLPVGTRIRVILKDAKFPHAIAGGADWDWGDAVVLDPDPNLTFMQDQLYVKNRRFNKRIDMGRDPTIYPFTSDDYIVEFYYNPRSAAPHMQDKFGFNGEGMADSNFLNTEVRPGQRVMFTQMNMTRDQIFRRGKFRDEVPVLMTKNFKQSSIVSSGSDEMIVVPNLRSQGAAPSAEAPTPKAPTPIAN
jgi:hypothetical protein